jgi:hypothetical protein
MFGFECSVFFGVFPNLRKATMSVVMSVRPLCISARLSIRMEQLCSYWTDVHEISYLCIFRNSVENVHFHYTLTRITGTLHKDLCTFVTTSRLILIRMTVFFQINVVEKMKTHFVFSNFFLKSYLFMIMWKNTVESDRP